MSDRPPERRGGFGWVAGLLLGARLALTGGREAWTRNALTAVGVGIGVVLLLAAASVPRLIDAREDRASARDYKYLDTSDRPADNTLLTFNQVTDFGDESIAGQLVKAEGPEAPVPPGLDRLPEAGEMYASPALAHLLESPEGELLQPRFPYRLVGEVGDQALTGPAELTYYAGVDELSIAAGANRIDHFGTRANPEELGPVLTLLLTIALVVLLLPVGIFVATAARFGSDRRDRRLAALRLVGADARTTARIAAGESFVGAVAGLGVGVLGFLLLRLVIDGVVLFEISVFGFDLAPTPVLALLIAIGVPAAAVGASMIGMRSVVVEPLGVVRKSGLRRRRLGWRLVLPVISLILLFPLIGSLGSPGGIDTFQVTTGVGLLLISVATLLPWIVEAVVGRLGSRGSVPMLLAVRRLQLEGGSSARSVSCVAVAVAGAIALQAVFSGAEKDQQVVETGDVGKPAIIINADASTSAGEMKLALADAAGATSVSIAVRADVGSESGSAVGGLWVASCDTIERMSAEHGCHNGDTFLSTFRAKGVGERLAGIRGETAQVGRGESAQDWVVPEGSRELLIHSNLVFEGVLATPGAALDLDLDRVADSVSAEVVLDPAAEDAADNVRNAAASLGPLVSTFNSGGLVVQTDPKFAQVRRMILAGVVATLALIGASLLVTGLEQLRERRRAIAALIAFGATRGSLARSVMWQAAVPVMLGIGLAIGVGLLLGSILLKIAELPVSFDWLAVLGFSAAGVLTIVLVTFLTLPLLSTLSRPSQLRME